MYNLEDIEATACTLVKNYFCFALLCYDGNNNNSCSDQPSLTDNFAKVKRYIGFSSAD